MERSTSSPVRLPTLIGRQTALLETRQLLARTPLLTLTGPGGSGKTRLALEIVHEEETAYPDGTWVVELAALLEPSLLPEVTNATLGVQPTPNDSPTERLIAFLRDRRALLVFDNCEHLLPSCAAFIEMLLRACARLRILVTSRESLDSPFEVVWPVPPLPVPVEDSRADARSAGAYEAVQLFVLRAVAAVPTFLLTDDNAAVISRICRCLDGLPLAIELAARCVKALALEQIAAQLTQDLHILAGGYRTASRRHQSLETAMEWSYHLLTSEEQTLFRRVSVLAGAFTLSAAAAVDGRSPGEVIDLLRRLIDKSLITVVERAGEARYRVLETLRQYGRQQLRGSGEHYDTCLRYSGWVMQLIHAVPPPSHTTRTSRTAVGPSEANWLDVCERELDHLRAVLSWMIDRNHSQAVHGLQLATTLTPFWRQRGSISEGRRWLEATLHVASCSSVEAPPSLRAQALNALGVLLMWQGAYAQAHRCHEDALALFDESGDQPGVARSLFRLGFLADGRGDYMAATKHLEQSLQICQDLADDLGVDMACNRLGIVAWNQGEYDRAVEALERSLAFQQDREALGACAATLLNLGILTLERGDPSRAMVLLQESLALNLTLHDTFALAYVQTYIGYTALCLHELQVSKQAFGDALAVLDPESAPEITCRLLDGIARLSAQQGRTAHAARIWGGMDAFRTRHECAFRPVEQHRHEEEAAAARQGMGTWAFSAAWREGCALSLADLLVEAKSSLGRRENIHAGSEAPTATEDAFARRFQTTRRSSQPTLILKAPQQATLRLHALGQVQVYRGHRAVTTTDLTYSKARELLFFLLTHGPSTKEQIALALWPDAPPDYLKNTFRVVVYHLRRALGHAGWLVRDQHYYTFNRSLDYWYDVEAFEAAAQEASRQQILAPDQAVALLQTAQALYHGDFWEGAMASEWIAWEQARLERKYLEMLLTLGELYRTQGTTQLALETFLCAIERDRYCEEAHRGAIRCYLQLHEPSKARQHVERLRQDLKEHLGFSPATETLALLDYVQE